MAGFQQWYSIDASPGALQSQSGIPGTEFENWENLTGPSDYMKKAVAPIAPPQTVGEYAQQAIAPTMQKVQNIQNAGNQIVQGNFMGTVNALKARQPVAQAAQPAMDEYDYTHGLNKIQGGP
jgi:hypothetical protein